MKKYKGEHGKRTYAIGTWRNYYGTGQVPPRNVTDPRGESVEGLKNNKAQKKGSK